MCEENSGVGAARVLFVGVVGSMENGPILGVRIVRVFVGVHVCVKCLGGRCRVIVDDCERSWVGENP